jgi:TonB family protein
MLSRLLVFAALLLPLAAFGQGYAPDSVFVPPVIEEGPPVLEERSADEPAENAFVQLDEVPQQLNLTEIQRAIVYPTAAQQAGITGKVLVRVLLDTNGVYIRHKVLRSPHAWLTESVEKQIRNLRFSPAVAGSRKIKTWVTVPFDFKLSRPTPPAVVEAKVTNLEAVKAAFKLPRGFGGKLVLDVQTDAQGNYKSHTVVEGSDMRLTKGKNAQVPASLRFTPRTEGGRTVETTVRVTISWP